MPDGTSIKFVEELEKDLAELSGCDAKIASGGGRMYVTMDRYEVAAAPSPLKAFPLQLLAWQPCPFCSLRVSCSGPPLCWHCLTQPSFS